MEEINRRVAISWKKYWAQKKVLKSKLPIKLKRIILDSTILPTAAKHGPTTRKQDTKSRQLREQWKEAA